MAVELRDEGEPGVELLLHLRENVGILGPETLHHLRRDDDLRLERLLVRLGLAEKRDELALKLYRLLWTLRSP